jgi:hypothetical protein
MKRPDIITSPHGGYKYTQPETGVLFHYFTWAEIMQNVGKHRQGMGLDLANGWIDRLMHDFCEQNSWLACQDDDRPPTFDTPLAIAGRERWAELHAFTESYAENPTEDDKTKARFWMAQWRERIPRFGGCSCREDWARLEANYPPDYSSRETLVRWASNGHDWVNRRIGKPIFRHEWFEASPCKDF